MNVTLLHLKPDIQYIRNTDKKRLVGSTWFTMSVSPMNTNIISYTKSTEKFKSKKLTGLI